MVTEALDAAGEVFAPVVVEGAVKMDGCDACYWRMARTI
jgi:hypothetical protein